MWIEAKRYGASGIPTARDLVEDADAIYEMIQDLADYLVHSHKPEKDLTENGCNLFSLIIDHLKDHEQTDFPLNSDDDILCYSEEKAEFLADFLQEILDSEGKQVTTGYYDPEEDQRNGEADSCTGLYYVHVC